MFLCVSVAHLEKRQPAISRLAYTWISRASEITQTVTYPGILNDIPLRDRKVGILTYPGLCKFGYLIPTYPWICKSRHLIPIYPGLSQSTKPIPGYRGISSGWLAQGFVFQMHCHICDTSVSCWESLSSSQAVYTQYILCAGPQLGV